MPSQIPWENNWNRTYRITLGVREYVKANYLTPELVFTKWFNVPEDTGDTIPSDAFTVDNLEDPRGFTFSFESQQVASSSGSSSERSTLILHNLSVEAKRILLQPNCICIIEAGYEGKLVKCYTGDVVSVTPTRNLPDITYNIQLAAEGNAVRNTMINTHYEEAMSTEDIIMDMAKRLPAVSVATYGLSEYSDRYKTGGFGFTGQLVHHFDRMMRKHNLEYAFSNNTIYIIPFRLKGADYDDFARTNYELSADSIKLVTDSSDNTKVGSADPQSKVKKLQVNTFYLPVEVGQFITIPTTDVLKEFAGTYIVKGRRIILQSTGNAWDVVLAVEELIQ